MKLWEFKNQVEYELRTNLNGYLVDGEQYTDHVSEMHRNFQEITFTNLNTLDDKRDALRFVDEIFYQIKESRR